MRTQNLVSSQSILLLFFVFVENDPSLTPLPPPPPSGKFHFLAGRVVTNPSQGTRATTKPFPANEEREEAFLFLSEK